MLSMGGVGFGSTELMVVLVVALVVLGPTKLVQAVHSLGQLWGKLQGFVAQARSDLSAQLNASDLSDVKKDIESAIGDVKKDLSQAASDFQSSMEGAADDAKKTLSADSAAASPTDGQQDGYTGEDFDSDGYLDMEPEPSAGSQRLPKRYRTGRTWDDVAEDMWRINRKMGRNASQLSRRANRHSPRARKARVAIYR